ASRCAGTRAVADRAPARAVPPSGSGLPAAPAGADWRLHRFLRRHSSRHQYRPTIAPAGPTFAQLQILAGGLSGPLFLGGGERRADPAAERATQASGRDGAEFW